MRARIPAVIVPPNFQLPTFRNTGTLSSAQPNADSARAIRSIATMEVRAPMPAGWAPFAVGDSGGVGLPFAAPASAARRRPHWPYDSTVWSGPIVGTTMASRGGHWPQDDIRRLTLLSPLFPIPPPPPLPCDDDRPTRSRPRNAATWHPRHSRLATRPAPSSS